MIGLEICGFMVKMDHVIGVNFWIHSRWVFNLSFFCIFFLNICDDLEFKKSK